MTIVEANSPSRIATLNDRFRRTFVGGSVNVTAGVAALPPLLRRRLLETIRAFESFDPDNAPYGEHDFGSVALEGERFFWKIDYYDRGLTCHSPDPADPNVTTRVLTVMLASEY